MRQRVGISASTSTSTTTVEDVEKPGTDDGASVAESASSWYSPNPVSSAAADPESVETGWNPAPPLVLEREPAPYSLHDGAGENPSTDSAGSERAGQNRRKEQPALRLGLFQLVRTMLSIVGLLCVIGTSAGLRATLPAATELHVRPPAGSEVELQGCRQTLATLRSRVAALESGSTSTQPGQAAAASGAAAATTVRQSTPPVLASQDSDTAYALVSEQLSTLHAEVRLTKMTSWDVVGSGAADAEEEAHAAQTLGGKPAAAVNTAKSRRIAVRSAFVRAYKTYETYAFGYDDLKPLRRKGEDWLGMGATIVDSLDTMLLMGLGSSPQYNRAREWVSSSLDVAPNRDISVFETSIRVLGGLLAAFSLTADNVYLQKAESLGANLLFAFDTKTGIPSSTVNLGQGPSRTKMKNPL
jgi:hypothetical protein